MEKENNAENSPNKGKKRGKVLLIIGISIASIISIIFIFSYTSITNISCKGGRKRSDISSASQLRTFVQAYMTESEDYNLKKLLEDDMSVEKLLQRFKEVVVLEDPYLKDTMREYGPYIDINNSFTPSWVPQRGGKHVGFEIIINVSNNTVQVNPIKEEKEEYTQKEMEGRAHRLVYIKDPEMNFTQKE